MEFERECFDPHVLSPQEEDRLLAGAPWQRFVALGDSIAEGVGESSAGYEHLHWVGRIARALSRQQPRLAHVNLGRRNLFAREVRESQLGSALEFNPDLAIVACGGNDILAREFDAGATRAEIAAIVSSLRASGSEVMVNTFFDIAAALEIPPPHGDRLRERTGDYAELVRDVAAEHDAIVIDYDRHPRARDRGLFSSDLRHLNAAGHAVAASAAIRLLGQRIGNGLARAPARS